ncbi:hypothetical protein PHISP_08382 [Aspergillus sp. HF37]|nr:hypothetical protein PHISP_08382 [Aspergillus sp. HF37]
MAAAMVPYDPATVAVTGTARNRFLLPCGESWDGRVRWVTVRLTAKGNEALGQLCHTNDQRTVWSFPCYEFTIRADSIRIQQIQTARPSYVNAILIASRGMVVADCGHDTHHIFRDTVRLPGWWGGACAGCKWRDHGRRCSHFDADEDPFFPQNTGSLPRNIVEELED